MKFQKYHVAMFELNKNSPLDLKVSLMLSIFTLVGVHVYSTHTNPNQPLNTHNSYIRCEDPHLDTPIILDKSKSSANAYNANTIAVIGCCYFGRH